MRLPRIALIVLCAGLVACKETDDSDAAAAFVQAAQALFNDKETVGGIQGMANAFMQSGAGKQASIQKSDSPDEITPLYTSVSRPC